MSSVADGTYPTAGEIPTAVLREAFARSGLSLAQVAYGMGRTRRKGRLWYADTTYVRRCMGQIPETAKKSKGRYRYAVRYETAVRFIRACGLDPVDFDL